MMKKNVVATQYAKIFMVKHKTKVIWRLAFLTSAILLVISCSKTDNLETIDNGSYENDLPIVNEPPINNNPPIFNANIIYTDIEPDFTSYTSNDFYHLDLNNDGNIDFTLKSFSESWAFWAEPNLNTNFINAFAAVGGPFECYIIPINENGVISEYESHYYFDDYGGYLVMELCDWHPPYCSYSWANKTDKYLGLRFLINDQPHYGWARLDVVSSSQWVIKDYAYNAIPKMPILAGQKE